MHILQKRICVIGVNPWETHIILPNP